MVGKRLIRKPSRELIVQQILKERSIPSEIFFSNRRLPEIVEARREIIRQLIADGAYPSEIAALIKRDVSVVNYHRNNNKRDRKTYYAEKWKQLRSDPIKYKKHLDDVRERRKSALNLRDTLINVRS